MKKLLLVFLATGSISVMAAETDWQPAQTLTKTPENTHQQAEQSKPDSTRQPETNTSTKLQDIPLPDAAMDYAGRMASPLPPDGIRRLHSILDNVQRSASVPPVTAAPRIRSLTVKLAPGSSLPMMQVLQNYPGVVNFTDQNGAPWPIAAPPVNGNEDGFQIRYLANTPSMVVQARRPYDTGSVTVYLKGLAVPVIISLSSGESANPAASQPTDSRLDLRIPETGPGTPEKKVAVRQKIGLYDTTMQSFLDGIPPPESILIKIRGEVPNTSVWQIGDDLYIRSHSELRDEFDSTLSSADGMHVYKLPVTPYLTFSVHGQTIPLTLEVQ